jgi:prepilin-type N-terminal cleavage/methylation domain-containing protein
MSKKFSILDLRPAATVREHGGLPVEPAGAPPRFFPIKNRKSKIANAFTLIEVLVVMVLLSLIVLALMAVFGSTQNAFRASVTQTDVLEGGRAAMDLVVQDLKEMSPSFGVSNGAVNFYAAITNSPGPLVQSLIASGQSRTNIVEKIFILSRENQTWTGVGYVVDPTSTSSINPLYRFSISTNVSAATPAMLFNIFITNSTAAMSHLLDGVVEFRVRAFDANGAWMNNFYTNVYNFKPLTAISGYGEAGFYMFSNTLPASVEIQMATLEDRTLQRASTWPDNSILQSNYLAQQSGKVHVFRQRVSIPNFAPSAYK